MVMLEPTVNVLGASVTVGPWYTCGRSAKSSVINVFMSSPFVLRGRGLSCLARHKLPHIVGHWLRRRCGLGFALTRGRWRWNLSRRRLRLNCLGLIVLSRRSEHLAEDLLPAGSLNAHVHARTDSAAIQDLYGSLDPRVRCLAVVVQDLLEDFRRTRSSERDGPLRSVDCSWSGTTMSRAVVRPVGRPSRTRTVLTKPILIQDWLPTHLRLFVVTRMTNACAPLATDLSTTPRWWYAKGIVRPHRAPPTRLPWPLPQPYGPDPPKSRCRLEPQRWSPSLAS